MPLSQAATSWRGRTNERRKPASASGPARTTHRPAHRTSPAANVEASTQSAQRPTADAAELSKVTPMTTRRFRLMDVPVVASATIELALQVLEVHREGV